jgi:hypothetical protein
MSISQNRYILLEREKELGASHVEVKDIDILIDHPVQPDDKPNWCWAYLFSELDEYYKFDKPRTPDEIYEQIREFEVGYKERFGEEEGEMIKPDESLNSAQTYKFFEQLGYVVLDPKEAFSMGGDEETSKELTPDKAFELLERHGLPIIYHMALPGDGTAHNVAIVGARRASDGSYGFQVLDPAYPGLTNWNRLKPISKNGWWFILEKKKRGH